MKRIISLLLLACPILTSAAPDNDKAAVQAVIAKYYNRPLAAHKCQLAKPPKDSETASDNIMYCMKPGCRSYRNAQRQSRALCVVHRFCLRYGTKSKTGRSCFFRSGRIVCLEKTDGKWAIKQHGKIKSAHGASRRRIRNGSLFRWAHKTGAMLPNQVIQAKATRRLRKTSCYR